MPRTFPAPPVGMATYRLRDLVRGPGLMSLARLPLAVAFALVIERDGWPWVVLGTSALSDVLDGWYARCSGQVTKAGAALDGVMDKVFVAVVVVSLVVAHRLSLVEALALGTRDLGELVILGRLSLARRERLTDWRRAHRLGKATTALQYLAVGAAVARIPGTPFLVGLTALTGALAAAAYWREETGP